MKASFRSYKNSSHFQMKNCYFLLLWICLAQVSFGQLTVNTSITNSTICAGSSIAITATVSPATPDPINYSWSPATGLNNTNSASVIATPPITTNYTVTATNTITLETGSASVIINIDPGSNSLAGFASGPVVCQNINIGGSGTTYRDAGCKIIADIVPAGAVPVTGSVNACVRIDSGANKMNSLDLYVARHYDIEPATNADNATANITLYFLQSEFDNYNLKSQDSGLFNVPAGPSDAAGIANMRIRQFHGTGTDPTNYTGGRYDFKSTTPGVSIFWNSSKNWWEITVPVTGFSGFYISSKKGSFTVLPVKMNYFKGGESSNRNILNWQASCTAEQIIFDIERSSNGMQFKSIGKITANQDRCSLPFTFYDDKPLPGANYYRLRMTDEDGRFAFSNILVLNVKIKSIQMLGLSPNVVTTEEPIITILSTNKNDVLLTITDITGRRVQSQTVNLKPGTNNLSIKTNTLIKGSYMLGVYAAEEAPQSTRFIKQ